MLTVMVVVYALWPSRPRLERYTSPSLAFKTNAVRFQVLVPSGWRLEDRSAVQMWDGQGSLARFYIFYPRERSLPSWAPGFVQRWLGAKPGRANRLVIAVTDLQSPDAEVTLREMVEQDWVSASGVRSRPHVLKAVTGDGRYLWCASFDPGTDDGIQSACSRIRESFRLFDQDNPSPDAHNL
jgi:hypothetical protein